MDEFNKKDILEGANAEIRSERERLAKLGLAQTLIDFARRFLHLEDDQSDIQNIVITLKDGTRKIVTDHGIIDSDAQDLPKD